MESLKIKIDDDKKQKWQSFTASVDLDLPEIFDSTMEGYGANEQEAIAELMANLNALVKDLNKKYELLIQQTQPIHKDSQ